MRIVGGEFRGRVLAAPTDDAIRPTTDRAREALFNVLAHAHADALDATRCLDLFAGTGALGLEALSRGCRFCLFVDEGSQSRALLRRNIEAFGLTGRTKVWRRDATRMGPVQQAPFAVAFADPPYGKGLGERSAAAVLDGGWLKRGALFVLEERADALPQTLRGFETLDIRRTGDSGFAIFRVSDTTPHDQTSPVTQA